MMSSLSIGTNWGFWELLNSIILCRYAQRPKTCEVTLIRSFHTKLKNKEPKILLVGELLR